MNFRIKTKMIKSEVIFEPEICSTPKPIEASRKRLMPSDKSENFWKLQCADLTKEKDVLKNQVQNLKKMVKEQSGVRQEKIELQLETVTEKLLAEQVKSAQFKDELENAKAELNKKKQEIGQLRRSTRNSTNSNHRHPNMNNVFKKKRLLEEENQHLSSMIAKLSGEKLDLSMKMMKNIELIKSMLGKPSKDFV